MSDPTAMHVDFALFRQDNVLYRGALFITAETSQSVFGEHRHGTVAEIPRLEAPLFSGLIVDHMFELPAAGISLKLYELEPAKGTIPERQVLRLQAALQMGVHLSDDWESVQLSSQHSLAFRCTPLIA